MHNYLDLTGRIALITGASSGIGAAAAKLMAEMGAQVAIGYHANQKGAEEVRGQIAQAGGKAITVRADVRLSREVHAMVKTVAEQLGPIDILVNNAGSLIKRMKILELTEERWDEVMDLNLKSAMLCSQAVAASMIERKRGAIVNIVSIAGRNGGGPGRGRLRDGERRPDYVHEIAGQGTGAAWGARERGIARGDRHAVSRSFFDTGDAAELCGYDSAGTAGDGDGMRHGDRVSGVRCGRFHGGRDGGGEWRAVDVVS